MKYHFASLERYLSEHVQHLVESTEGNQILKKNFLMIKLALYQYLRFDDKGKEVACYQLEIARKQIKEVLRHYSNQKSTSRVLECLLLILDSILEVANYRDIKKLPAEGFRYITLGNINITSKEEILQEEYMNKLIMSAFTITNFLSLEWPTEIKSRGEQIDKFLSTKKVMLEQGIRESLTIYQSLGEEGKKGVRL